MKKHHVIYAFVAFVLIIGLLFILFPMPPHVAAPTATSTPAGLATTSTATIPTQASTIQPMHFEIVTTAAAQERGLGGRADIPENFGMLFVFAQADRYGFWMKDMLEPIDMIWLDTDGTILKIDANVQPNTYPEAFYPPKPVKYVLETRANEAARRGWKTGIKVELPSGTL
jgi:uncharacterized membrane protein (UPF0127 family)